MTPNVIVTCHCDRQTPGHVLDCPDEVLWTVTNPRRESCCDSRCSHPCKQNDPSVADAHYGVQVDYPAACNAVEKVLVHESLAQDGRLFKLQTAMRDAGACMHGTNQASLSGGCNYLAPPFGIYAVP